VKVVSFEVLYYFLNVRYTKPTACVHVSVISLGLQKLEVKSQNCQVLISKTIYQALQLEVFWSINYHFTILVKFAKFLHVIVGGK
jgi:hypothetical protein